jgi:hypothetical protein
MAHPEYRGFGWSEVKHPKALQLYRLCAARGWLQAGDPRLRSPPPTEVDLDGNPSSSPTLQSGEQVFTAGFLA